MKNIISKNLIVGNINNDIYEIASIMKENDVGFLPINNNKKIVGVITDRDIVIKAIYNKDTNIKNYISKKIINIDINNNIEDALNIMTKYKVKRLIVTDKLLVCGVISISDILNNYDDLKIIKTLKAIYEIKDYSKNDTEIDEFYL